MGSAYNNPAQFFQQLSGFIQGEVDQGVSRKAKEMRELSGLTEGGAFAGGTIERKKGGRNVNAVSSGPERVARRARARQAIIERNRERKAARAEGRETTPDESPRLEDAAVPPKVDLSRFLENRGKQGLGGPQTVARDTSGTPEVSLPAFLASLGKGYTEEQEGPPRDSGPEMSPRPSTPAQPSISHYPGSPIGPQRSGPPFDDEARRQEQMAIDIARGQEANRREGANRIAVSPYLRPYEGISDAEMDQMALDISRSQAMPYNDQDPVDRDVQVLLRQLGELGVEQGINSGLPPAPNDAVRAPMPQPAYPFGQLRTRSSDFQNMGPFPEDYYFQQGTAPPLDLPFGSNIDRIMMPPRMPDIPRSPSEAYFDPRDARRRLIDMPGGRPDIPQSPSEVYFDEEARRQGIRNLRLTQPRIPPMFLPPTGPVLMPARY